jgi:hypothetical protein
MLESPLARLHLHAHVGRLYATFTLTHIYTGLRKLGLGGGLVRYGLLPGAALVFYCNGAPNMAH